MTIIPQILDACCGMKMFHHDKDNPNVLFMDIRHGDYSVDSKKALVYPDIVEDFRSMPFDDCTFNLVIYDPPHLLWAGPKGRMRAVYGELNRKTWKEDIKKGFDECWRVLKQGGTLIFKWSECQVKKKEVEKLYPAIPIISNKVNHKGSTHFVVFYKTVEKRR